MIKNEETKDYSYSQGNTESQEKQKGTDNSCRIPTENLLDSPKEKAVMIKQPPQQIYGNPLLEEKPKCLGNAKAFLYIGRYPLITLGPDYCIPLTLIAFMTALQVLFYFLLYPKCLKLVRITETATYLVYVCSHLLVTFINPGVPSFSYIEMVKAIRNNDYNNGNEENSHYIKCDKCNISSLKKDGVGHCKICNVCVIQRDHHCPWTGKCIGKNNIVFFYIFVSSYLCYIFISFTMVLICLLNLITEQK